MEFKEITKRYEKEGFKRIYWEDYEKILKILLRKIENYLEKNNIKIDVVVPILRGGAFPGTYLAFKLKLIRILPVQYKYFFNKGKIQLRKLLGLPEEINLPKNPVILLVENNHCFGLTAKTAAKEIKEQFKDAKIIYASDFMDYSYQKNEYADVLFYGKLNNDTKTLSEEKTKELGLDAYSTLFPWEIEDEEWSTIKTKQFGYQDEKEAKINSELKEEL
jgi:hypoxanthine phosphoribosyltransferase